MVAIEDKNLDQIAGPNVERMASITLTTIVSEGINIRIAQADKILNFSDTTVSKSFLEWCIIGLSKYIVQDVVEGFLGLLTGQNHGWRYGGLQLEILLGILVPPGYTKWMMGCSTKFRGR